jgi:tetratricopeptide (TPR) repeat protein
MALAREGSADSAVQAALRYVEEPKSEPPHPAARARLAAGLMEQLARDFRAQAAVFTPAAEKMYRQYVSQAGSLEDVEGKEAILALAAFLGRQERVAEALDLCEQAWGKCRPEAVAMISLAICSKGNADPQQVRRLEQRLTAEQAKQPGSIPLLTALALLCDSQKRYGETEALYREIIQKDRANIPALNNLAYLLALQGKGKEAKGYVGNAIEISGRRAELLDTLAVAHLSLGESQPALRALEEAVEADGTPLTFLLPAEVQQAAAKANALAHFHLAQAHLVAGDRKSAEAAWRRARASRLTDGDLLALEQNAYQKMQAEFPTR